MIFNKLKLLRSPALRIALIYLFFSAAWIVFSDKLLTLVAADLSQFEYVSLFKGLTFVSLTALLIYLMVHRTLLQQKALEQHLANSEERWKFALEGAEEGVWDWDLRTDEVFRSGQWRNIFGYAENEVGRTATEGRQLMHPEDVFRAVAEMDAYLMGKTPALHSEFRMRCKDGSWKWVLSRGIIVARTEDGRPLRVIGTHTDISERKKTELEIFHLAHYDKVTELPNRVLFYDRLAQEIEHSKRRNTSLALMFLDLDRFKEVNDTLGHDFGDFLLKETAKRLKTCVRASDTVARLGGDEFTILLTDQKHTGGIETIAQEVLNQLFQPFQIADQAIYMSASIGITLFPEDAQNVEALLKNADQAMYAAKAQGGNCLNFYTSALQEASLRRMHITSDLRIAIAEKQFELHYQPIVEIATRKMIKAEALLRWRHPEKGLIPPSEFIPIAEDTGLIIPIGDWVFTQAAEQALKWRARLPNFQISVNKSPVQIRQSKTREVDWLGHLAAIGLDGDAIVVEITESLLLDAQPSVTSRLKSLHLAGLKIAIDDFGTGYSSLAYLKKFDIGFIKIDQSFVKGLQPTGEDRALCEAIIVMAHKLGIKVIAEGIETQLQHDLLLAAGCDFGQGYFYSRPVPAGQFESLFLSDT